MITLPLSSTLRIDDTDDLLFEAARKRVLNRTRRPLSEKFDSKNDNEKQKTEEIKDSGNSVTPVQSEKNYFKPRRDNALPFIPRLLKKPFSTCPLHPRIVEAQVQYGIRSSSDDITELLQNKKSCNLLQSHLAQMGVHNGSSSINDLDFLHPYENEIEELEFDIDITEPVMYKSYEETSFEYIITQEQLQNMIEELSKFQEVAIDLEHHEKSSYQGFTCLIQLSSREKDYIIDPFPLFHSLEILNEITCNPNIIKVLHGADRDIKWLQRDFGVYVVNMFDTGQACRVLGFPGGFSLKNLYEKKCNFSPDKTHQLSDWRQRPLPQGMIDYARSDTHYLLYAYDKIKEDLGSEDNLMKVWYNSKNLTLQRFSKKLPNCVELATKIGTKNGKGRLNTRAFAVLECLLAWREQEAVEQDLGPMLVLPDLEACILAEKQPSADKIVSTLFPLATPQRVRLNLDAVARALQLAPAKSSISNNLESSKASLPGPQEQVGGSSSSNLKATMESEDTGEVIERTPELEKKPVVDLSNLIDYNNASVQAKIAARRPSISLPPLDTITEMEDVATEYKIIVTSPKIKNKETNDEQYSITVMFDGNELKQKKNVKSTIKRPLAVAEVYADIITEVEQEAEEKRRKIEEEEKKLEEAKRLAKKKEEKELEAQEASEVPLQSLRLLYPKEMSKKRSIGDLLSDTQSQKSQNENGNRSNKKRKKDKRNKKGTGSGVDDVEVQQLSISVPAPQGKQLFDPTMKATIKKKGKKKGKKR